MATKWPMTHWWVILFILWSFLAIGVVSILWVAWVIHDKIRGS